MTLRPLSPRRAAREAEARDWRHAFKIRIGRCEHCLKSKAPEYLDCDEIARGCHRSKALTAAFAMLCVCRLYHAIVQPWTRAKRLALLYLVRSTDYDLEAFWKLTSRRFPEQSEVDVEVEKLLNSRTQ